MAHWYSGSIGRIEVYFKPCNYVIITASPIWTRLITVFVSRTLPDLGTTVTLFKLTTDVVSSLAENQLVLIMTPGDRVLDLPHVQ